MPSEARHVYGPRPLGALLPAISRAVFRRRAPAAAAVLADWPCIVGPALAAVTAPQRLQSGTLTIACPGPIAMELQHLSIELLARINAHLGSVTVRQLRFVQTPVNAPRLGPEPAPPGPLSEARAVAERAVAGLPAGPLRDALAKLGAAVLSA